MHFSFNNILLSPIKIIFRNGPEMYSFSTEKRANHQKSRCRLAGTMIGSITSRCSRNEHARTLETAEIEPSAMNNPTGYRCRS